MSDSETTKPDMTPAIRTELAKIKNSIATLSDGKWDKRDVSALVSLFGGISGLLAAGALLLQSFGVL